MNEVGQNQLRSPRNETPRLLTVYGPPQSDMSYRISTALGFCTCHVNQSDTLRMSGSPVDPSRTETGGSTRAERPWKRFLLGELRGGDGLEKTYFSPGENPIMRIHEIMGLPLIWVQTSFLHVLFFVFL